MLEAKFMAGGGNVPIKPSKAKMPVKPQPKAK
jgi:hypothetical protein